MSSLQHLRSVNLNQLPILREILRQESITRAAESLNLSQPAVSNVLKSLRGHFGDDLLTRDGTNMRRTTKGEELLLLLETALAHIESAIKGGEFDPALATGPVRIATVDNVISTFAGPMCQKLEKEAPNLEVQFVIATHNLAGDLKSGAVDIAVTSTEFMDSPAIPESLRKELCTKPVGVERLVCIGRSDDVQLANGLSLDVYLSRPHASYVVDPDHHHTVERQHIRDVGLSRSTRIATSSNHTLPAIVANSNCIAIVPMTLAKSAARQYPIKIFRPPFDLPDIKWVMAWHERGSVNPLLRWSKDAILRCSKELEL
ncbi:LysR family transcriptional regulator [Sphingorhabdus sp. Alg239-R122]|uniref:LysR family transcriptional regulator n=1 Tax=Sphingorhabdus sp. Alg239-R122 TaxID=2305989 RepID=UPI0023DD6787|nr:LysR family transcriptional regulator [Sphingorhabdus sp. Alg239-R122]